MNVHYLSAKTERDAPLLESNGATLFPNTFSMQEFTRNHYDEFLDLKDAGETVDVPRIYTIPRDLNRSLDDFFDSAATKESVESWLASHPFEAASDNAEEAWKNV
ncbi:hypothetical protein BM221_002002 [Beauveria bassiana]|uniref:Tse2 ADP-ribosyltransferase toxin domain-containing protein n=1 Tax=Beauveria bassiana TaxID=176275 RepID=A0A2N6NXA6_BEABA|nr:hypothetical protein BM221_002002 [Beauveria bassiana]